MALTQLGQIAMFTTDLALLGRLGAAVMAAAALANTVLFAAFVIGLGVTSAVAPLAAQAYGAREPRMVRRTLRAGLWVAVLLGVPLSAAMFFGQEFLAALGQQEETSRLAARYLSGLAWGLVPAWAFIVFRGFMGAVNRPEPALWIMLAAMPANGLLAYTLIYGAFGLPGLDVLGAGLATATVNSGMCVAAVVAVYTLRPFKKYRVLGNVWRADWPLLGKLFRVGLPISGAFSLEYGLFAAAAFMMGTISTIALAAHQIAMQVASILFMVPFGVSMAATVRVGHALGRGDMPAARRAGFAAIAVGASFMALMTATVAATQHLIPWVFLSEQAPLANETADLASKLLVLGATFFIADGIQTVSAGALRGLNDTRMPLLFSAASFWLVGFPASYGLAFAGGLGPQGVWAGLTLGLICYASSLIWRFHGLTCTPLCTSRRTVIPLRPAGE
jgi:MATE family multidrug resistance protein